MQCMLKSLSQLYRRSLIHDMARFLLGEKPFDTIEDLVQDGLITLYMEANNVELYLKSAKESLRPEQPPPYTPPKEGEGSSEGTGDPSPLPGGKGVGKRNRYSPCTIPVKRDSIILGDAPSSAPTVDELKDSSAQGEASILSPSGAMPKTVSCGGGGGREGGESPNE